MNRSLNGEISNQIMFSLLKKQLPMPLSKYMDICLTHPEHGYYPHKQVFGSKGDFVTSPEFTQLIGELLAVGIAYSQQKRPIELVEFGPGQGKLMSDMLRTFNRLNIPIAKVHFIETSTKLKQIQKTALQQYKVDINWADNIESISFQYPFISVAHEFFDAIPIDKYEKINSDWYSVNVMESEALETISENECRLKYRHLPVEKSFDHPDNKLEVSPIREELMGKLCRALSTHNGMMYIIDYGKHGRISDSFRAIKDHKYIDPLTYPGEADLTSDVDFKSLANIAEANNLTALYSSQKEFLHALGLRERVVQLLQSSPEKEKEIWQMYDRLVNMNAYQVLRIYSTQSVKL